MDVIFVGKYAKVDVKYYCDLVISVVIIFVLLKFVQNGNTPCSEMVLHVLS